MKRSQMFIMSVWVRRERERDEEMGENVAYGNNIVAKQTATVFLWTRECKFSALFGSCNFINKVDPFSPTTKEK